MESQRNISKFILLGLSYDQSIQIFCFVFFLFCYLALLVGNLLILVSIQCSPLFNLPMYYFLSNFSFTDICYTSNVTLKLIGDLLVEIKAISYSNYTLQLFTMHIFASIEVFTLTAMAFDRYIAICKSLHYVTIINRKKCNTLVLAAWAGGPVHSFPQLLIMIQSPFCVPNEIHHYFCDIFPLLKVACSDTYITGVLVVASSGMTALVTFTVLCVSYAIILFTLRNHSAEGRHKALSICGSHISVVILLFGPINFIYLRPPTAFPEGKIFALFYNIITPMFNPLIYTLRKTEMKISMRNVWCQR